MTKFLLVVATVIGLGLATLLVAVSGYLFGGGPQSMNAGPLALIAYGAAVLACVALPVVGFMLNARGKAGAGLFAAFLPAIVGFFVLLVPAL